jgi:RNA polymerase sigma-70 factor (ECF subfamily)
MSRALAANPKGEALEHAFAEIFREHYQLIYRTAYSVTGSRQDAEDVVQAIFLRLLQRRTPLEARTLKGYLYRAAVNEALSSLRSRKRYDTSDDVERLQQPVAHPPADSGDGNRQVLLEAIAQLRPRAVEILILHYEHHYSDREIAKMLNTSRGTIAVTLYRARARLKKLVARTLAGGKP